MSRMSKPESQSESNRTAEAVEPPQPRIPHAPSPCGLFGKLPPELLEPIYQSVFTAGETALTRTSKAMHAGTKEALSRHGVYSLRIEFGRLHHYYQNQRYFSFRLIELGLQGYHLSHPTPGAFLANVRHLNIRVVLERPSSDRSLEYPCISGRMLGWILWRVVRAMMQPTHCRISLQLRKYRPVLRQWFAPLKQLRCFQTVEVELCHALWEPWNQYGRLYGYVSPLQYRENNDVAVEAVRAYLGPMRAGMSAPSVTVVQRNFFVVD